MFWNVFFDKCKKMNKSPTAVATELKIGIGSITKWKNGTIPNGETLIKLSDYLNCSIDELLGRSMPSNNETDNFKETLYRAYNAAPEHIQKTIADILNITDTPTAADDIVTHLS